MVRLSRFEYDREQLWLRALEEHPDGMTQNQLAALVGISPGHLSRRLARARRLKITPEELYEFELIESPNPIATHGCERHHLIQVGSLRICLACGKSGMDHATPFHGVQPPTENSKQSEDQPQGTPVFVPRLKRAARKS